METRQIAEKIAQRLDLPVDQVARILRTEHAVIQEQVTAGTRVVLTGFLSLERNKGGSAKIKPGTTFSRLLHGDKDVKLAVTAPAVRATSKDQMTRRETTSTTSGSPTTE